MHIGMIGGIGPAATQFYYQNLVKSYRLAKQALELTIVHSEAADLVENIQSNNPVKQAEIFRKLTLRLQSAGADQVVISSIAGHFCIPEFEKISPLPIVNAVSALDAEILKRGLKRVGVLGNRVSMQTYLFGGITSAQVVLPLAGDLDTVHDEYMKMAISGKVNSNQQEQLHSIGNKLCNEQGAEAVVLAGTDLFLAFDGIDCGFPVIDSALVHIDSLVKMSTSV